MKIQLIKLQNKLIWTLIKALFNSKTKFKTILKTASKERLEEFKNTALSKEDYELAAVLEYYINFKFKELKLAD